MRARFFKKSLFLSAFTIFMFLLSFPPSRLSIGGATCPQDPNATLPSSKTTTPSKKTASSKKKSPTSRRPSPQSSTSTSTDFIGKTIVLNRGDANGTISGEITWSGPTPIQRIDTSADPVCGQESPNLTTEYYIVNRGKLANVFVYVKDGTTSAYGQFRDLAFETPAEEVVLDQKGCRFVPHVLGLQVNQRLKISNSDPTQHNIHPTPRNNQEWNQTQPHGALPIEKRFTRAEVLVPVKCNQHPWMKAYIGVLKHPFFAVSGKDGRFKIEGVPAGTYTLAAWHEKGGPTGTEDTVNVTVNPQTTSSVSFRFGMATAAKRHPSLEMITAIEVLMLGKVTLHQH